MSLLQIGVLLLALGAVVGLGGMVYWFKNMGTTVTSAFEPGGFGKAAMKMLPIGIGGMMCAAGVITIIIHYAEKATGG